MKQDDLSRFYAIAAGFFTNLAAFYYVGIVAPRNWYDFVNNLLYCVGCIASAYIALRQSEITRDR